MRDLSNENMWVELIVLIAVFGSHALLNLCFNQHKFDKFLGCTSVLCIILALFIIIVQIDWLFTPLLLAIAVVLGFALAPLCGNYDKAKRLKKQYLKELRRVQSVYTSAKEAKEKVINPLLRVYIVHPCHQSMSRRMWSWCRGGVL
jgi:hypothetical protein